VFSDVACCGCEWEAVLRVEGQPGDRERLLDQQCDTSVNIIYDQDSTKFAVNLAVIESVKWGMMAVL
jgi:hypothetical protein